MNTKYECYVYEQLVLNTKAHIMNFCLKNLGWDLKETDNSGGFKMLALFLSVWIVMSMETKTIDARRRVTDIWNEVSKNISDISYKK